MKDLSRRVPVAIALIALLFLVVFAGGWFQAVILGLFAFVAVLEMRNMFRQFDINCFCLPQAVFGLTMFVILYKFGVDYTALCALLVFLAIMIERIFNKNRRVDDVMGEFTIMIYPLSIMLFFGIIGFESTGVSRLALLCCFAGPCMADNTAYMVGSLIGKHKLCPHISPNKTIEGAVAGIFGGTLGGVLVWALQGIWDFSAPLWFYLVVCTIVGIVGQFGDLFASTFKRRAGLKDFGHIFPGHGGVMDRIDSAMVAAPVVYALFRIFGQY